MSVNSPSTNPKKKKTKTFTGCATCRSRKIKCDLGKPACQRCTKSGLECAGYQIVLCWSKPIEFDKYGYVLRSSAFPNEFDEGDQQRGFQRRNVDFVKYDREYETYEEMDRDLGLLHTPEYTLIEHNKTWMQGPFGVFEGLTKVPDVLMKKRRRLAKSKYAQQSREDSLNSEQPRELDEDELRHKNDKQAAIGTNRSGAVNLQQADNVASSTNSNKNALSTTSQSPNSSHLLNWTTTPHQASLLDESHKFSQEWISNELRYDALLSASAAATSLTNEHNNVFFDLLYPMNNPSSSSASGSSNSFGLSQMNSNNNSNNMNNMLNGRSQNPDFGSSNRQQYNDREVFNALRPQQNYNLDILNDLNSFTASLSQSNSQLLGSDSNQHHTQQHHQHQQHQQMTSTSSNGRHLAPSEQGVTYENDDNIILETNESHMPESIIKKIKTPLEMTTAEIKIPTIGLQINSLTRYLLNYYVQEVANMLTVVGFKHNPWKTIYFPKAIMALGDVSTFGRTSNSRMSILNALLAVSCFRLQSKYTKGSKEMVFFVNLGFEFRLQASSFLKKVFDDQSKGQGQAQALGQAPGQGQVDFDKIVQTEKYKDILVALLSMISVDFVWGTLAGCQYHLGLLEIIISRRMKDRPRLSNKAKILHRLYTQVKGLQDSTNVDNLNKLQDPAKVEQMFQKFESFFNAKNYAAGTKCRVTGEFHEVVDKTTGVFNIQYKYTNTLITQKSPEFVDDVTKKTKTNKYVIDSAATFGLPNSLILLFNETVELIKLKYYIKRQPANTDASKLLIQRYCEIIKYFEVEIVNWESEWQCKSETTEFLSDLHQALYHHSISFHNSLIVYFFTMIKDVKNQYLQKYVKATIDHLESLQTIVETKKVDMAPLIWQGFIAGFSAVNNNEEIGGDLQGRFKEWAKLFAKSGISTYWGARQIMFEIWRRRENKEANDNWVSVHKDWDMNLMLT
ncbi:hypothetical protein WICPIJ_008400 [Wickerhamomyces pijperi]|uniref:Zn(2)-C6 fungal-type domain-containing protein n=1 Tax=Wickerhamomyces pijperi TaxID=599730 RepID=A0A9P8PXC9_WICPI|nr:hypothetical protein WICPIJ_008400 [Wickerhamomyces pijperi]